MSFTFAAAPQKLNYISFLFSHLIILFPPLNSPIMEWATPDFALLPPGTPDWPVSTRSPVARADFRYEFSLSAGPEFDTDSAPPATCASDDTTLHPESSAPGPAPAPELNVITSGTASAGPSRGQKVQLAIHKSRSTPSFSGPGSASGTLSHTKMCRDRLNNMFERLRHTLPPAPAGVEVKHKAQVLDYAIDVLKGMVERTSQLEMELAVSSSKATMDWISKLVGRAESFPVAAKEVMRLFCKRRVWTHAELWMAGKRAVGPEAELEEAVVLKYCSCVSNVEGGPLERFSKESEGYVFRARQCVQGRVWASMRPEWVAGLSDPNVFRRSSLAMKYGVKVCLAVPVTITGKIEAIMCFYDVKHRPYDLQCLELAMRLGWALGNAVGVQRAHAASNVNITVLAPSGTSAHDCNLKSL